MTEEILQSDIDLARKLITVGAADADIVQTLQYRGLDPQRAAQLVQDLRLGRTVHPDPDPALLSARSRQQPAPERPSQQVRPPAPVRETRRSRHFGWFPVIAGTSILLCIGVIAFVNHRTHARLEAARGDGADSDPGAMPTLASLQENPAALQIQITQAGLRIGGASVSRANALGVIASVLGRPTRTNSIGAANQFVYAFDSHGLLVYPEKEPGRDSIVIDFEASGGTNGATKPFPGTLKIEDRVVSAGSSSKALGSLGKSGANGGGATSGIFSLKYDRFSLIFAYLTSPDHLSSVEIDFD